MSTNGEESKPCEELFYAHVHLHGGPAPVRRFLPRLIELVWNKKINPGKVFDLTLPLTQAAEGYRAMDERRAIKTLLRPPGTCPRAAGTNHRRTGNDRMVERRTAQHRPGR